MTQNALDFGLLVAVDLVGHARLEIEIVLLILDLHVLGCFEQTERQNFVGVGHESLQSSHG